MSVIDRAKNHFENLGVQSIEVPEWKDNDDKPTIIYWNPITLAEKNKLLKVSGNLNDVSLLADILIMKALDKDGKKLFTLEDKIALMHKTDPDVLTSIANKMVAAISPDEVKTPELKNLLIVADRLKITLSQLFKMEVWEYNTWLGFLLNEQKEHESEVRKAKHR